MCGRGCRCLIAGPQFSTFFSPYWAVAVADYVLATASWTPGSGLAIFLIVARLTAATTPDCAVAVTLRVAIHLAVPAPGGVWNVAINGEYVTNKGHGEVRWGRGRVEAEKNSPRVLCYALSGGQPPEKFRRRS